MKEKRKLGLRRGLSLLPANAGTYRIGRGDKSVILTTPFARTATLAIAKGQDPFAQVPASHHWLIEELITSLATADLLTQGRREIALPPRYLNEIVERDIAAQQLRNRCEPELLQCEWSDAARAFGHDEGAEILAARATVRVLISGRNRVATLLHSLLLASGVSLVEFIDRFDRAAISDCDIGTSTITAKEYAENFYAYLHSQRRSVSLFPLERRPAKQRDSGKDKYATLVIHSGPLDIEDLIDWLTARQPHFIIQSAIADEITMGPLVIPGITPCLRCADLNQVDRLGYSSADRISLTDTPEIAMVGAHFIASVAAAQILHFIDSAREGQSFADLSANSVASADSALSADSVASPIARSTTVNLQNLLAAKSHSITVHPLCGCGSFREYPKKK
jgi:hypothetical protein